jgi:hypothetical protein
MPELVQTALLAALPSTHERHINQELGFHSFIVLLGTENCCALKNQRIGSLAFL